MCNHALCARPRPSPASPCSNSTALQVVHTLLCVGRDVGPLGACPPCAGSAGEEASRPPPRGPHPKCPYLPLHHTPSKWNPDAVHTDRVGSTGRNVPTSVTGIPTTVRVSFCLGLVKAGQDAPPSLPCWLPLLHVSGTNNGTPLETRR